MKLINKIWNPSSETKIVIESLKKSKSSIIGSFIIVIFIFLAIFGPILAPYDPIKFHVESRFMPPSWKFLLGTDEFGRDILSRIIFGARIAFIVSITTVIISMVIGVTIGAISGYYSGRIDLFVMRIVDIFTSFPSFILALGVMAILGRGIDKLILVLPIVAWTRYTRIVRSIVLSIREQPFIEASKLFGRSNLSIIYNHILVNVIPPCIVLATFQFGSAILTEASLSYIGLGINPPNPSWGNMLTNSRQYILKAPHAAFFPGLAITLVILAFNMLGDALRDALDPRLRV
jgi:peptide/nickel transport system permease protein